MFRPRQRLGALPALRRTRFPSLQRGRSPLFFGARELADQPIPELVSGATISLPWLVGASIVNGSYEEIFLIGYLSSALEAFGAPLAIGVRVPVRVLYSLYQGPVGAISMLVVRVISAVYFWHTRKLWPVVFSHIFADVAAFAMP